MRLQYGNIFVKEITGKFILINAFIVEEEKLKINRDKHLAPKDWSIKQTLKY